MAYRCVATSVAGFVQQLAVSYVTAGYWFYVSGQIPLHKDPAKTDEKIIAQYGIDISKWARARRKKAGLANVHYLRFDRFFVIVATGGEHSFFTSERNQIRDIRREPLRFMGYSIGYRQARDGQTWHASVRICLDTYRELKRHFESMATYRSGEELVKEFRAMPYEPYAPVRDQIRCMLRAVNRRRRLAGLHPVPDDAVRSRRSPVRPF